MIDPSIQKIIGLFRLVDLNYTEYLKRSVERNAVDIMLKNHGASAIEDILNKAVIYNKLPYIKPADKVYSPTQLLRNWAKIIDKEAEIKVKPMVAQKEASDKASARVVW